MNELETEDYLRGLEAGKTYEHDRFTTALSRILCFDFQAEGFCTHHGGKCKDIQELLDRMNP